MLFAYALAIVLLHSGFGTNHMEAERHGDYGFWPRTNVIIFTNVTAVVGDGIPAIRHTNSTAVATNITWMMVVDGKAVPVPMTITNGSWLSTNWYNLNLLAATNSYYYDDSRLTNLPSLIGESLPLTAEQAAVRGLPAVPQR